MEYVTHPGFENPPPALEMVEKWRDIEGYENRYEVSNVGRVKTVKRTVKVNIINALYGPVIRTIQPRLLKPYRSKPGGRLLVALADENGNLKRLPIDVLVLQTFIGKKNYAKPIHLDGNIDNNCADNLQWQIAPDNYYYGRERLLPSVQNLKYKKRLEKWEIEAIYCSNQNHQTLSEVYKISPLAVQLIKQGIWWEHVTRHMIKKRVNQHIKRQTP